MVGEHFQLLQMAVDLHIGLSSVDATWISHTVLFQWFNKIPRLYDGSQLAACAEIMRVVPRPRPAFQLPALGSGSGLALGDRIARLVPRSNAPTRRSLPNSLILYCALNRKNALSCRSVHLDIWPSCPESVEGKGRRYGKRQYVPDRGRLQTDQWRNWLWVYGPFAS